MADAIEYPTEKQIKDAKTLAKSLKDRGCDMDREIYLATRQMNKFKSERIRGHYQAQIDAFAQLR